MNEFELWCKVERQAGGCEFSNVAVLPAEISQLDGKSVKVDGETIRFRMWQGKRLYVNCRSWTLGYFVPRELDLSWGSPVAWRLEGNHPSPMVAHAVAQLLGIEAYRTVTA